MNQGQDQIRAIPLERPPPSFADLIKWAILRSPRQRATAEEICEAVKATYAFYQDPEEFEFLKAGVRHRTSRLPQFKLTDEKPAGRTAKGNYWIYVAELDRPAAARGRSNTFSDVSGSPSLSTGPTVTAEGLPGSGTDTTHGSTSPLEAALASVSLGAPTDQNLGIGSTGTPSARVDEEEMMRYFDIDRLERDRAASDFSGSL